MERGAWLEHKDAAKMLIKNFLDLLMVMKNTISK
jgi:hypothetical protein